jgi:hypothetical protein
MRVLSKHETVRAWRRNQVQPPRSHEKRSLKCGQIIPDWQANCGWVLLGATRVVGGALLGEG